MLSLHGFVIEFGCLGIASIAKQAVVLVGM